MNYILEKYKKYNIKYDLINCILKINKSIPVEIFVKLKVDLIRYEIYVRDIVIESRG